MARKRLIAAPTRRPKTLCCERWKHGKRAVKQGSYLTTKEGFTGGWGRRRTGRSTVRPAALQGRGRRKQGHWSARQPQNTNNATPNAPVNQAPKLNDNAKVARSGFKKREKKIFRPGIQARKVRV